MSVHEGHCHDLLNSLSDYVDGTLQAELCQELERHLRDCHKCRVVVNTLKKTVELYQETGDETEMPQEVRQRLFARLQLDDFLNKENV